MAEGLIVPRPTCTAGRKGSTVKTVVSASETLGPPHKLPSKVAATPSARVENTADESEDKKLARIRIVSSVENARPTYRSYLKGRVENCEVPLFIDSGNTFRSCINQQMCDALGLKDSDLQPLPRRTSVGTAKKDSKLTVKGETKEEISIWITPYAPPLKIKLVVLPELEMNVNLSGPDLARYDILIKLSQYLLYRGVKVPFFKKDEFADGLKQHGAKIYTAAAVTVGPLERVHVKAVTEDPFVVGKDVYLSSIADFSDRFDLHPWHNVITTVQPGKGGNGVTKVGMMNTTGNPIHVPKGTFYGTIDVVTTPEKFEQEPFHVCLLDSGNREEKFDDSRVRKEPDAQYRIPPPPNKQDDPMAGDDFYVPPWMQGPTSLKNWKKRADYLRQLYNVDQNKNLTNEKERSSFLMLLLRNWEVFAWDGRYGNTDLVQHYIKTPPGGRPVFVRAKYQNPALEQSLKEQLKKWLKHKVIEPADSNWNSNLLAVAKKDSSSAVRWCVDYRSLNAETEVDRFCIGDIADNLSRLGGSRLFSALDNSGAFHIIKIAPEDRYKTAFATKQNQWQFTRLPFGLAGGPSSYSRLVTQVLRGIPPEVAVAYVDDVLVHSHTFTEHLSGLARVLNAYRRAGMKLNPKKCIFVASKIDYLGHTVSAAGIEPQEAYLRIVKNWPVPKTLQEILIALGKFGYYRKFVPGYACIAKPLTDLLQITTKSADAKPQSKTACTKQEQQESIRLSKIERKKKFQEPIQLNATQIKAFKVLRDRVVSSPILGHPRFNAAGDELFILDTDWCHDNGAIAACLSQRQRQQDGTLREVAIGFAAKKLAKSQLNYSSTKGEICAILYFMRYFAYFLSNQKFLIRTDNVGARALKSSDDPPGMISRWRQRLESFDYDIIHRAGSRHGNADALSRCPHIKECEPTDEVDVFDEDTDRQHMHAIGGPDKTTLPKEVWSSDYIKALQEEDYDIAKVRHWVSSGQKPRPVERAEASSSLKAYINLLDTMSIGRDDVLRYHYIRKAYGDQEEFSRWIIVLPDHAMEDAVRAIHKSIAHLAVDNTMLSALRYVYNPNLRRIAEYVCRTCLTCQAKGGKVKPQSHTLEPPRQSYPFFQCNCDIVGPLTPSSNNNVYILTVECMFTRWLEAFPIRRATGQAVVNKLTRDFFPRFGFPSLLKFDRGTHFKNHMMQELTEMLGVTTIFSPAYHPSGNPVERQHRTLKDMLKALLWENTREQPSKWEEFLPAALFALRTMRNAATGYSPYELTFGRLPNTELDLIFGTVPERREYANYHDYHRAFMHKMNMAFHWANKNISGAIQRCRRYHYNQPKFTFPIGSRVWLLTPVTRPGQRKSFLSPWTGPWVVLSKVNEVVYKIGPNPNWSHKQTHVVTADRLKKYEAPEGEGTGDDVESTYPPGMNDDLSFPTDEFLENVPTQASYRSDDDDEDDFQMPLPHVHVPLPPVVPPAAPPAAHPPQPVAAPVPQQPQGQARVQGPPEVPDVPAHDASFADPGPSRESTPKPSRPTRTRRHRSPQSPARKLPRRNVTSKYYDPAHRKDDDEDDHLAAAQAATDTEVETPEEDRDPLEDVIQGDPSVFSNPDDTIVDEFPDIDLSDQTRVLQERRHFAEQHARAADRARGLHDEAGRRQRSLRRLHNLSDSNLQKLLASPPRHVESVSELRTSVAALADPLPHSRVQQLRQDSPLRGVAAAARAHLHCDAVRDDVKRLDVTDSTAQDSFASAKESLSDSQNTTTSPRLSSPKQHQRTRSLSVPRKQPT